MTSPGGSSPLRIGGFALIGVAVVAALVGLLTLATGGSSSDPALAQSASTSEATPSAEAPAAPGDAGGATPPGAEAAPPVASTPAPGGPTTPAAATPSEEVIAPYTPSPSENLSSLRAPLRVYNNSTISGLAERAAEDFRVAGWDVTEVGNYSQGVIPTSTVYYENGDEATAQALADEFGMRAMPRFAGLQQATPGLIVIITREYRGN